MKRAIALLLAFVFVFALIPVSALAANYTVSVTTGVITGQSNPYTFADADVGTSVTVEATPPTGQVLQNWTAVPSGAVAGKDLTASSLTFDLPSYSVALEAHCSLPLITATGCTIKVNTAEPVSNTATASEGNSIVVTAPETDSNGGRLVGFTVSKKTGGTITPGGTLPQASFTMPLSNVTVTPKYEYPVTVKLGTAVVGAWYQTPGAISDAQSLTIPSDKKLKTTTADITFSPAGTGFAVSDLTDTATASSLKFNWGDATVKQPVTITLTADQLYKVNHTGSTFDSAPAISKGDYVAATQSVILTPDAPSGLSAGDFQVKNWTNELSGTVNSTTGKLAFTMPGTEVTTAPIYRYKLTVTHATATTDDTTAATIAAGGSAFLLKGTNVTATATVAATESFDKWGTHTGISLSEADEKTNPLTFAMPETVAALDQTPKALLDVTMGAKTNDTTPLVIAEKVAKYSFNGGASLDAGKQIEGDVLDISAQETVTVGTAAYVFDHWDTPAAGAGTIADTGSRVTTFTVGASAGTPTAVYAQKVTMTVTAKYGSTSVNKTYTFTGGDTAAELTAPVISGYSFMNWSGATTAISAYFDGISTSPVTFTVPKGTATLAVTANYQPYYALSVSGVEKEDILINGTAATATSVNVPAGSAIEINCNEAGVRKFNGWTASPDLPGTVDLSNKKLSFTMPAKAQSVAANYTTTAGAEYVTGAYLLVEYNGKKPSANNQRYYARQEFLHKSGEFDILMAPTFDVPATETVAAEDLYYYCRPSTGGDWFDATSNGFLSIGTFDLKVEYRIGGRSGTLVAISPEYPSAIVVLARRPEYIVMAQAPTNTEMYRGEDINMSGSYVWLKAADKDTHGGSIYYDVRELTSSQYTVYPKWDNTLKKYVGEDGAPVTEETDSKGTFIRIVLAYKDPTQADKPMTWIVPADGKDKIYLMESAVAGSLKLTAATTATSGTDKDVITPASNEAVKGSDGKWTIVYGTSGTRTLTADLTIPAGSAATKESFISGWTNSDPSVATINAVAGNPLRYEIRVISSGETTVSVKLKGSAEAASFKLHVLSSPDENTTPVESFQLNPTNLELYVGSRFAVGTQNFSPANASTVIGKWESVYQNDGTDASYCVSVDDTGTVTVNHYTDEKVIIRAIPKYRASDAVKAECILTIRKVAVTNMTLSPASLTLYNKASKQLTATILPEGATDKTVNWTSSDSDIVSVDANGIVTGNKVGTATVTATCADNANVKKTCTITVVASVLSTSLELSRTSLSLGLNETTTLVAYISPSNATTQSVTWSSDNTNVAKVDTNGKVTSVNAGIATITAAINDGSGLTASCLVTVSKIISNAVTLNKQTLALIEGDSEQITATVFPTNVTTVGVKWTTSNSAVATVDNNGTIVGVGGGAAIITATANDGSGKYADCVVAVTPKIAVESVTLNLASFNLLLNDTTTLTANILPKNATYGKLVWTSSDTNVATVDEKGKVSGLKLGNSIITCKAGDKSVSITVTVANTLFSAGTVVNCARRVNVRSKASGASKAVGYAYLGDTYKVLNKTGRWYLIQYNATTQAYIWDNYLNSTTGVKGYTSSGAATGGTTPAPGTTAAPVTGKTVTIINCTNCVNVRSGAGTTYSWIGYANLGETYTYTNLTNGFYEIAYGDTTGYVSASFAKANG